MKRALLYAVLAMAAATFIYPFLWMAATTFKPASEVGTLSLRPRPSHLRQLPASCGRGRGSDAR